MEGNKSWTFYNKNFWRIPLFLDAVEDSIMTQLPTRSHEVLRFLKEINF